MISLKTVVSKDAPKQKNCIWAKPVDGGYALYILAKGKWCPIIPAVPDDTKGTDDDEYGYATKDQGEMAETAIQKIKINGVEVEKKTTESTVTINDPGHGPGGSGFITPGDIGLGISGGLSSNGTPIPPEVNIELGSAALAESSDFQPAIQVGTWEEKPEQPYIGQMYYCTDIIPPMLLILDDPLVISDGFNGYCRGSLIVCAGYYEENDISAAEPMWCDMCGNSISYEDMSIAHWEEMAVEAQDNNG